jgi:hypothetical protein
MYGIKHTNTGKPSINKTPPLLISKAVSVYEEKYFVMNVTHALEHLKTLEEYILQMDGSHQKWKVKELSAFFLAFYLLQL